MGEDGAESGVRRSERDFEEGQPRSTTTLCAEQTHCDAKFEKTPNEEKATQEVMSRVGHAIG